MATTCCRRKNAQATRKKAVMMWPKRYRLHIPKKFAIRSQNRNVTVCPSRSQKRFDLVDKYTINFNIVLIQKCFHVPKTHCENVPVKSPISVPLEKCWEVPRKHCQSIPVKKPRIVVKKVPVKHCEYKGHHDDHHGYGHDDHHGGGYGHDDHHGGGSGHDDHHGGGYGHHRRSDDETPKYTSPYDPYSSTLKKLIPNIPNFSRSKTPSYKNFTPRYVPSHSPEPAYTENPGYSSSYDKHVDKYLASSVPTYEEYGQISFDETRPGSSPEEEYLLGSSSLDHYM